MNTHYLPYKETGYFSTLICNYLAKKEELANFYGNFPDLEGFKQQLIARKKTNLNATARAVLVSSLKKQYKGVTITESTQVAIESLLAKNTFTITTGHQLNIFTGPLYFLYKIISVINLTKQLKKQFPTNNYVPVYWMATEDHDFEEINYFNFKGQKVQWNRESEGAVGRMDLEGFTEIFNQFSAALGNTTNATYLKKLFKKAYLNHNNLANATRYLVNKLFGSYGLVIIDGDAVDLKRQFAPIVKNELLHKTSFKEVSKTNKLLQENYKIQVNPREINLFYIVKGIRERIVFEANLFKVNNTNKVFLEEEILKELEQHPERFSPNALMRPLYQETILPNLAYIGGGGELAYWFQLKNYFNAVNTPFPILVLRNSVLMVSSKQLKKLDNLHVGLHEIFYKQEALVTKKVKELSAFPIDFSEQKRFLQKQFIGLKELALKTDVSFIGAVKAQEKKQLNGLDALEKRLLKAQKRKFTDELDRVKVLQNELFPAKSLEERSLNFSTYYLELGENLIPMLTKALQPLQLAFTVVVY